ncbi:hypothetical protein FCM35_KLT00918 [Carex littledalei]|uniref:Uncharacterized protein n=1 Tax=Carex littledalei TaxID=544730 RepID=A0A833R4B9_9POAL|nr:hypothetical protein FCM35_KLT00918 [Carex littledalei]
MTKLKAIPTGGGWLKVTAVNRRQHQRYPLHNGRYRKDFQTAPPHSRQNRQPRTYYANQGERRSRPNSYQNRRMEPNRRRRSTLRPNSLLLNLFPPPIPSLATKLSPSPTYNPSFQNLHFHPSKFPLPKQAFNKHTAMVKNRQLNLLHRNQPHPTRNTPNPSRSYAQRKSPKRSKCGNEPELVILRYRSLAGSKMRYQLPRQRTPPPPQSFFDQVRQDNLKALRGINTDEGGKEIIKIEYDTLLSIWTHLPQGEEKDRIEATLKKSLHYEAKDRERMLRLLANEKGKNITTQGPGQSTPADKPGPAVLQEDGQLDRPFVVPTGDEAGKIILDFLNPDFTEDRTPEVQADVEMTPRASPLSAHIGFEDPTQVRSNFSNSPTPTLILGPEINMGLTTEQRNRWADMDDEFELGSPIRVLHGEGLKNNRGLDELGESFDLGENFDWAVQNDGNPSPILINDSSHINQIFSETTINIPTNQETTPAYTDPNLIQNHPQPDMPHQQTPQQTTHIPTQTTLRRSVRILEQETSINYATNTKQPKDKNKAAQSKKLKKNIEQAAVVAALQDEVISKTPLDANQVAEVDNLCGILQPADQSTGKEPVEATPTIQATASEENHTLLESEPEEVTDNEDPTSDKEADGSDKDEDMLNYEDEESVLTGIDYESDVDMDSNDGEENGKGDGPADA